MEAADDVACDPEVERAAVPVRGVDVAEGSAESAALDALLGSARVVALGEIPHGSAEALEHRNRLVRFLVDARGFGAVGLETGGVEALALARYGLGVAAGSAEDACRHFTWGFGELSANAQLLDWLRRRNAAGTRSVRLFGFDVPGGDVDHGLRGAPRTLRVLAEGLANASAPTALVECVKQAAVAFEPDSYRQLPARDRQRIAGVLDGAAQVVRSVRDPQVRKDLELAITSALGLVELFEAWPPAGTSPADAARWTAAIAVRDRFMADRVLDRLAAEPESRMLLFAHAGHVMATPPRPRGDGTPPLPMGVHLRRALGPDYRALVIAAADAGGGGRIAEAQAAVNARLRGAPLPALLALHELTDPWWRQPQVLLGDQDRIDVSPSGAFDGVIAVPALTPARRFGRGP